MVYREPIIGIDLGATECCVGLWRDRANRVDILTNDQGKRTTPTCINFSSGGRLIGDSAANHAATNPLNTIFGVKRLIGRAFVDPEVQSEIHHLPYSVQDQYGRPGIQVDYLGQQKLFSPEEICAMFLLKMKQTAENHLGQPVTHAVIAVPAHFNSSQRQATRDAGKIAGLEVLRIVNEPTAVTFAYVYDKAINLSDGEERKIIVVDIGGGTLDVSQIELSGCDDIVCEVKSISGRTNLGGDDFDRRLTSYLVQDLRLKTGKDISSNPRALRRLKTACERAKRDLSAATTASIQLDSLFDRTDYYTTITRQKFQELCADLFTEVLDVIKDVLDQTRSSAAAIKDVLLVGGSSRMPLLTKIISDFFHKEPYKGLNADEAVAYGATLMGAMIKGKSTPKHILAMDAAPLNIGVETILSADRTPSLKDSMDGGGNMTAILRRNSSLPTKGSNKFTTYFRNQNRVVAHIYEGKDTSVKNNHFLGTIEVNGLPPLTQVHEIKVSVDVSIDYHNITVSVHDVCHGLSKDLKISSPYCLSKADIERMMDEAREYQAYDEIALARSTAKNNLESYVFAMQNALNDTIEWLDRSPGASKEEFEQKLRDLLAFRPELGS